MGKEVGLAAGAVKSAWKDAADTTSRLFTEGPVANAVTEWTTRNVQNSKTMLGVYMDELTAKLSTPLVKTGASDWAANARTNTDAATKDDTKTPVTEGPVFSPWEPDPKAEADREARLQELRDFTSTEADLELNAFNERMIALDEMKANGLVSEQEYYSMQESLMQKHAAKMNELEIEGLKTGKKWMKADTSERFSMMAGYFGNVATLMQSGNKKLFEIGKIAAYAQAVMNTAAGATNALKDVPYPFNIAAMASVIAAGAVQIATISSTSFGGGGGVNAGGSAATAASAPMPGEMNNRGIPSLADSQRSITVNIQGESFTRTQVQDLIDQINDAQRDGNRID
jgi:hypothetical protein